MKQKDLLLTLWKHFWLLIIALGFSSSLLAQSRITVTGVVTDSVNASSVLGASVMLKGTTTGTQTDVNGKFTLSAAPGSILLVRYIGYNEKQVVVQTDGNINIRLSPSS